MINFPVPTFDGQLVVVGSTTYRYSASRGRWMVNYVVPGTGTVITPAVFSCQATTSVGYFGLPNGTTAQRPVNLIPNGALRYNTITGLPEVYKTSSSTWVSIVSTGGYTVNYLAVAGGGGGSTGTGGAGGFVTSTATVYTGTQYAITVGAGGAGGTGLTSGTTGSNTIIAGKGLGVIAVGGGAGAGGCSLGQLGGSGGSIGGSTRFTGQQATGGNSVYTTSTGIFSGTSYVHVFTATGTSYFTASNAITVAYLVVAGGGAGGSNNQPDGRAGGGGAGGLVTGRFTATAGLTYIVTVGAGGAQTSGTSPGNNGQFSSITTGTTVITTATGGGGGGGWSASGLPGGSGGGGGAAPNGPIGTGGTGVPGQGNSGGSGATDNSTYRSSGGGGGAGAVGATASGLPTYLTAGGVGLPSSITGTPTYYAGGGGGGGAGGLGGGGAAPGIPGTPGTGGGGGSSYVANTIIGGAGGPGIVVLSYAVVSSATFSTPYIFGQGHITQSLYGGGSGADGQPSQGGTGTVWLASTTTIYAAGGLPATGTSNSGNGGTFNSAGGPGVAIIGYPGTAQRGQGGTTSTFNNLFFHTFTAPGTYTA